jgi:signal transduction histidine kinase
LRFEVVDTGAGFDRTQAEVGAGLMNMHDRLGAIGGVLVVDATPGIGTRVQGSVPVIATSSVGDEELSVRAAMV